MKFRQLEAFRLVMSTGSMVSAADHMNISQPAVSRLISDLEASLGFQVFSRRRGTLSPTTQGLQFFELVEEHFLGLEQLQNASLHIKAQNYTLRIAVTHALSATFMPAVISRFQKRFPDCRISLRSHRLVQVIQRLQNMSVDIAVAAQLPQVNGTRRSFIGGCRQICVLPKGHPAARKSVIRPKDLEGETILVIPSDGPANWDRVPQLMQSHSLSFRNVIEVDTSFSCYAMIEQGLAVGVIEPFGNRLFADRDIVTRPFEPEIKTDFFITEVIRSALRSEHEWMVTCIREEATSCPEFE